MKASKIASLIGTSLVVVFLSTITMLPRHAQAAPAAAPDAVKTIDTDCSAIQDAVMALKPVHVGLVENTWKVLSDKDYAVAQQSNAKITLADAWRSTGGYAWVHVHSFDANGNQRATQLCFRQNDGTLQRARQATTMPALNSASAQEAYFASDGSLIFKAGAFDQNDPAVTKTIQALPFYSVLP